MDEVRYKDKTPAVSVIIPIYNTSRYLRSALDSVLGQSFHDIEIVCVEDGSEDNSREILLEYAAKDERIVTILVDSNQGLCQSRKTGILHSSGEYVMFLDSDDEYLPGTCARVYEEIVSIGSDMLQFGAKTVTEGNVPESMRNGIEDYFNSESQVIKDSDLLKACFIEHRFGPQVVNKLYRGEVIRRAAKEMDPGHISYAEDWYLFCITAYYSRSFASISEPFYVYRLGSGMSTGKFNTLSRFEKILEEKQVSDAIGRFLGKEENAGRYDEVAAWIAAHFIDESVRAWIRDVQGTDFGIEAFKKLLDTYGEDALLSYADRAADGLKCDAAALKNENAKLNEELKRLRETTETLRNEIEGIKSSKAYKAGMMLAAPVRKLRSKKK